MLVNIIQNTISSFISAGVAAAEVITTNLKMWLGFETSETLGREEVVNGDFASNTWWTVETPDAVISNGKANFNTARTNYGIYRVDLLTTGKQYEVVFTIDSYTSGAVHLNIGGVVVNSYSSEDTFTAYITGGGTEDFGIQSDNGGAELSINNVSLKELTQITPDKSGNNNVGELFTGKAIEFDGAGAYVDVDGFQMAGTNATFAFWFNSNDTLGRFFDTVKDLSDNRLIISFNNNQISILDHTVSWFNFGSVTTNVWNRCVITIKGTTAKCFVNGIQLGTDKTVSTIDLSLNTNAAIGSHFAGTQSYFDGEISDFQIYNADWSTDDIAFDYANPNILVTDSTNTGTSIAVTNLKAYWAMSEGAGFLAYDSSGEGNNGTINGATYKPVQPRIPQLGMQNWSKGSNLFPYSEDFTEWIISPTTSQAVLAASEAAPYGQGDVYSILMQASESDAYIRYATTNATLTSSTHSVWVKQAPTGSATHIRITNNNRAAWNTGTSKKIALTSNWQRLETTDSITGNRFTIIGSAEPVTGAKDPDCLGKALVYGAQLVEGSSAGVYRFTDGAATSNSTVIANPTIPTQDIFGNAVRDRLNSFNLDGSGYAEVAEVSGLDVTDFSIEAWVKFDYTHSGSNTNVIYVNGGVSASVNTFALATDEDNKVRFIVGGVTIYSTTVFSNNNWVHIVGTRESGALKLYINGNKTPEATGTGNAVVNNTSDLLVGRDTQVNRFYKERISDVRLYGAPLSADEVENNYNAGLSAHTN